MRLAGRVNAPLTLSFFIETFLLSDHDFERADAVRYPLSTGFHLLLQKKDLWWDLYYDERDFIHDYHRAFLTIAHDVKLLKSYIEGDMPVWC